MHNVFVIFIFHSNWELSSNEKHIHKYNVIPTVNGTRVKYIIIFSNEFKKEIKKPLYYN